MTALVSQVACVHDISFYIGMNSMILQHNNNFSISLASPTAESQAGHSVANSLASWYLINGG